MADVHERIGKARQEVDGDPIPHVAAGIAEEAALLCFDEMQVTDIADAMILGRLFKHLFERGVVVVATSNSAPAALYENGLNRQLFLPFIRLIEAHMDVAELKSAKDYRLEKLAGLPLYFAPADAAAKAELDAHWDRLTGRHPGEAETLEVKGRSVRVPLASMGIARFPFRDLCEAPLGTIDYLRIAHTYHTVMIDGIPVMAARPARGGAPLHQPHRHAVRQQGLPHRLGGGRAGRPVRGQRRRQGLRADRLAPDRDAQRRLPCRPRHPRPLSLDRPDVSELRTASRHPIMAQPGSAWRARRRA